MKVLIIKLGALGDMIIASPIIKQILKHHAVDEVCLMTTTPFKDLFSEWQQLKIKSVERGGLIGTVKQIHWLRGQGFERIYDLQSNDRTSLLCALSGVGYRAGNHPRYPYHVHPESKYIGQCHSFERLNEIVAAAGLEKARPEPCLPVSDDCRTKVTQWLNQHSLKPKSFALLHAGSSKQHKQKRWPSFDMLAAGIENNGKKVVWIGGSDDIELNQQLSKKTGIDSSKQFSIAELVALGEQAGFAVTNDSAPMHILSCCGIPVFGLFGPTNPLRTHALGQTNRVISPAGKLPVNDREFEPSEISHITTAEVMDKLYAENLL